MYPLRTRGEVDNDLLANVFKVYIACSDDEFINYINRYQESYEEVGKVIIDNLMLLEDSK